MKTLYISDLDGTLLNKDSKISDYSLNVINSLIKSGVVFSYATARSLSSASVVTKGLELACPAVIYNGAFIVNTQSKEKLLENSFSAKEIKNAACLFKEGGVYPLVYSFIDGAEKVSWLSNTENEGMLHYINNRKSDGRFREVSDASQLYEGDVFYFTCIGAKEELEPVNKLFSGHTEYSQIFQQELSRPEYWFEVMPKNATKANAVLQLKKLLGCDKIVAFGDGKNDISMFLAADECYAMSNAAPELKEISTKVIDSNENDGVVKQLLKMC